MVNINVIRASNTALARSQPLTAVVTGGTSGIGKYTVQALAAAHGTQGKGLRIYIVGRNEKAAQEIIAGCLGDCPSGDFIFVKAENLALVSDVDNVCAEIKSSIEKAEGTPKVDILVMTQAIVSFNGRQETKEGLDRDMSLLYYSRMRLITQLLPLLLASPLPAHAISVYAAGMEAKYFPTDLSLRDPNHYSFMNCRSHAVYMKTSFMETLARQYPERLSLAHYFPGLVETEGIYLPTMPKVVRFGWTILGPLLRFFCVPQGESGERVLFLATSRYPARKRVDHADPDAKLPAGKDETAVATGTDGESGSGAYALNWDDEPVKKSKAYANMTENDLAGKVWDHTMAAFAAIEAGKAFTA